MIVSGFRGVNVESVEKADPEHEMLINAKVDYQILWPMGFNERVNATALGAAIMGMFNYRPSNGNNGTVVVTNDGIIQV